MSLSPCVQIPAEDAWQRLSNLVLDAVSSPHSRRAYRFALNDFFAWYSSGSRGEFRKSLILEYRAELESRVLSPSTINIRLAAVRKLAIEAADNGLLSADLASGVSKIKGVKRLGVRAGNWLEPHQARALLQAPSGQGVKAVRDRALLAVLLGCALRRAEVVPLEFGHIQLRAARWVIPDLVGKGNRLRTVPIPVWVKQRLDAWQIISGIESGPIFRPVSKSNEIGQNALTENAVWWIVREYAGKLDLGNVAPHDLRRTCARMCRESNGSIEQIQLLLGHGSIQTTMNYLGTLQNLTDAVNDHLALAD